MKKPTKEEKRLANEAGIGSTVYGYDGNGYGVGDRVELSPHLDLWMRGAKFGTVVSLSLTPLDRVKVRSDHPRVRNLIAGPADYFKKVQS